MGEACCRIPGFRLFKNSNCAHFWGVPDYYKDVLTLQISIFQNRRVSGRTWHREPFSLWVQFSHFVLFLPGVFPTPCVEDRCNLLLDLCRGFYLIHPPTVLIIYLFPVLVVCDISSHIFFNLWVYWPAICIHKHWESQFWEREPEPWRFLCHQ